MGTGYTRNDTVNNIADGNIINASDLDGEFDAVQAAFDAATGHTHDGTTGEGAPIEVTGPAQEYVSTNTAFRPKANNTYDLGSSGNQWKDLYVDGTANLDAVDIDGGNIDGTVIGASTAAAGTFTTATATTGNITTVNATTVDTTNIEVTNIKAKDGTAAGSIADATGVVTLASSVLTTTDINGGTIDGTTIGGASAAAGTFTNVTANGTISLAGATVSNGGSVTTIDINGGTIDGTVIGGSTPAAISGTTGTFSGNLTVDTNVLFVDAANNRVGVGLSDPSEVLHIRNGNALIDGVSNYPFLRLRATSLTASFFEVKQGASANATFSISDARSFIFESNSTERLRITSAGNVGIGTSSPANQLTLESADPTIRLNETSGGFSILSGNGGNLFFSADNDNDVASSSIQFRVDGTERLRITSTGNVGIGTSSPADPLHVSGKGRFEGVGSFEALELITSDTNRVFVTGNSSASGDMWRVGTSTSNPSLNIDALQATGQIIFRTAGTNERMRITSTGNVGIGESIPLERLDVGGGVARFSNNTTPANEGDGAAYFGKIGGTAFMSNGSAVSFRTASSERMRIDTSGNVGIGLSAPGSRLQVDALGGAPDTTASTTISRANLTLSSGGAGTLGTGTFLSAGVGGAEYVWLQAQNTGDNTRKNIALNPVGGNVGIGTTSPSALGSDITTVDVAGPVGGGIRLRRTNATATNAFAAALNGEFRLSSVDAVPMTFHTNNTERARIDASGNLLVGTTTATTNSPSIYFRPNTASGITVDGDRCLQLSRLTSDGNILQFRKDGTTVGNILVMTASVAGVCLTDDAYNGIALANDRNAWLPVTPAGALSDDTTDIGTASVRMDDIYATNGTIQTSDRNEKQDIEALSDAEQRVAVACKGLMRKFRWKSSVEEKGDDARIHFGIIAQDLQAAFEAEGLDAGRYAMFISSTWTDEETGEERSRMGVRYPQLLAFIIAAI